MQQGQRWGPSWRGTGVTPSETSSLFCRTDQQQGPGHGQLSSHTLGASGEKVSLWEPPWPIFWGPQRGPRTWVNRRRVVIVISAMLITEFFLLIHPHGARVRLTW